LKKLYQTLYAIFLKMLQFAVFFIMILEVTKVKGYDGAFVLSVETRLEECSDLLGAMGIWVGERLLDTRRLDEDTFTEQLEGKLETCDAIYEVVDTLRAASVGFVRPVYGTIGVRLSESFFLRALLLHVSKKIGDVLFIASRDGDSGTDFHEACDDKGPTIVICETTTGNIFGGYTDKNWGSDGWVYSNLSFLFGVRPTLKKYAIRGGDANRAIAGVSNYGPIFGGGHDLVIKNGALSKNESYTNGATYAMSGFELNDGVYNFQLNDYVVLQAIAI